MVGMQAKQGLEQSRSARSQVSVSVFLAVAAGLMGLLALIAGGIRMILGKKVLVEPDLDEMPEVLFYLRDHLGSEVTAYLSGADSPDLFARWVEGGAQPQADHEQRLRPAYEAARSIVQAYDDETARQWFGGMNPSLEDTAPAYVLRHGSPKQWGSVVSAAMEFVETAR
jgi:hypothetical protein